MKKLLALALFATLGVGLALAQNINKSVQLSQDPTGDIGYDTNKNVYFPGHILSTTSSSVPAPTISVCGTGGSVGITGTDAAGTVVSGSTNALGSCLVTFGRAYAAAPSCIVQVVNPQTSPMSYTVATTGIQTGTQLGVSNTFYYWCSGKS